MLYYKEHRKEHEAFYNLCINQFLSRTDDALVLQNYETYKMYVNTFIKSGFDTRTMGDMAVFCNKFEKEEILPILDQPLRNDFKDVKTDKRGVPVGINVPQHILDVVCIVKFNAAFRRHTSLNILHALEDDGRICNSKGAYVDFLWNKFRVTADGGLRREYRYTDDLFIDALVKAHADVASDSQRVIGIMIDTETELHKKNKDSEAS